MIDIFSDCDKMEKEQPRRKTCATSFYRLENDHSLNCDDIACFGLDLKYATTAGVIALLSISPLKRILQNGF